MSLINTRLCGATLLAPVLLLTLLTTPLHAASDTDRPAPAYRVYVSNEQSGDLSVIDPATHTVTATIPVGKRPRGINPSPDRRTLYVALSGSPIAGPGVDESKLPPADKKADGIGVIDLAAGKLVKKLHSGSDPEQFSLSNDGRLLYVANEDAGQATVLDAHTGSPVATLSVGDEPEGVATSPDGRWVYVTSESSNRVHVIDTKSNKITADFPTGERPRAIAFTPDGAKAYVTCETDGTLTVVDAKAHKPLKQLPLRRGEPDALLRPMGIVLSPDGKRAFVTTGRGRSVLSLDTATDTLTHRLDNVGDRPWGIALSPDGQTLYTANGPSNDVSVINATTLTLIQRIPAGTSPWGVAIVPK